MALEFNNLIAFNNHIGLPSPPDKDFEVSKLERSKDHAISSVRSFEHSFFSVCLAETLDAKLSAGHYKRAPHAPFLLFRSPYQAMAWQPQPGMHTGWQLIFTENFMKRYGPL